MAQVDQISRRVIFPRYGQRRFLEQACEQLLGHWDEVARLCGIHRRTLFDWRREKYTISASAIERIREHLQLEPLQVRLVDPYRHVRRAGRVGARVRYQLYGNPGTLEGRRKGGFASQRFFHQNPAHALRVGFKIRKLITRPAHSQQLAEFVGLMLGDGHLGHYQAALYFNRKTEGQLARYAKRLIADLFGVTATLRPNDSNCWCLVISSRNLTEWLSTIGLRHGDKMANHVAVPAWVFQQPEFMRSCLRGLMDTDGSVFFHTHTTHRHMYRHIGLAFTSYSPPLLSSAHRLMKALGYHPRVYPSRGHLYLYRRDEVNRYMQEVGTHNPNHWRRFRSYRSSTVF